MMKALSVASLFIISASIVQAQDQPREQPQEQPRSQPRSGGIGGIGGINIGISLGKKKPRLPDIPAIEMRDVVIPDYLPDQVIFVTEGSANNINSIANSAKVTVIDSAFLDQSGVIMVVAQLNEGDSVADATARLSNTKGVSWSQPNHLFQLLGKKSPKRFALHAIPDSQRKVYGKIVMIDAPVDAGHPNLTGADFTQQIFGVAITPTMHGTAVAALLVGTGDYPGTAQGAQLTSLAAFGQSAADVSLSRTSYLAKAMNEASRLRPDVLNLSFGGPQDRLLSLTLNTIHTKGVCVAAAAGNGGPSGNVLFPASHLHSLAVTAVDEKLRGYAHASRGDRVDISGVGVGLNAASPGGRRSVSGTSFANAVISGALLRMPACNGGRNPAAMKTQVRLFAFDLGAVGHDPIFGAGLFRLSVQTTQK